MNNWQIVTTASYVPQMIVSNDRLSTIMDTSDEWIRTRTGIRQRHISQGENTADLATQVGQRLLAKAHWAPTSLDLIIIATMSPDSYTPSTAAIVQGLLGATAARAFDVSAACSGFVYALDIASRFIGSECHRVMVIGSEVLSKITNWQDRTTAVLFGDGAGGVLIETDPEPHLLGQHLATFGDRSNQLVAGQTRVNHQFPPTITDVSPFQMNGRAVYRFATHAVPISIQTALQNAGLTANQVDRFILHQANIRIIQQVARRLVQPMTKFPTNIDQYGNTSAASEPILLDECVRQGLIRRGDLVVLSGFGGGLTVGTMIIKY